jgi:hypothetical protein
MSSDEQTKPQKLTKKGLPDRRGQTSAKNLAKGKSIIKEALKIAKEKQQCKPKLEVIYSSDEYSTDEEEIILTTNLTTTEGTKPEPKAKHVAKSLPIDIPKLDRKETTEGTKSEAEHIVKSLPIDIPKSEAEHYTFTFEKKLEDRLKVLNEDYTKKLSHIENEVRDHAEQTKLTKAELKAIKEQNQALKKSMTNNFRTQAGVMNQEMFLKF